MLSYPFTGELAAASQGSRIAWMVNERGVRNIFTAEGPDFEPHRITNYSADDGQELTNVSVSPDGRFVVYVRGGDHDANWDAEGNLQPDPNHSPVQPVVQIWAAPTSGDAAPKLLAGEADVLRSRPERIAHVVPERRQAGVRLAAR